MLNVTISRLKSLGLTKNRLTAFVKVTENVQPLPSHKSPLLLVDEFMMFFSNKIKDLKSKLRSSELSSAKMSLTISQVPSVSSKVSVNYVSELLGKSKTKSSILDPAPTSVIKQSIEVVSPAISSIVNESLSSGVFPKSLKRAVIGPTIKKHGLDEEVYANYRPITNIAFLSKILEQVTSTQTLNYLVLNGLLAKLQSAYRAFYSTETALLRVFNDILSIVLLDLSAAAFDDHAALLARLKYRYGICGTMLKWFESYLVGRIQQVLVKGFFYLLNLS